MVFADTQAFSAPNGAMCVFQTAGSGGKANEVKDLYFLASAFTR